MSLAISGDRAGVDATLAPLLQKQDKAAWRTRAFALAILGKTEEAEAIARQTLAPDLAVAMAAYLRYMPKLTAAQQAAAGNLGAFPRAADIGHDDPRVALYARPRGTLASADQTLIPAGQPLGAAPTPAPASTRGPRRRDKPPTPAPSTAPKPAPTAVAPPPVVQPSRVVTADPGPARVFATPAATPTPTPAAAPKPTPNATLAAATPPPPKPAPAPAATTAAATSAPAATSPSPGFAALETGPAAPPAGFDLARTTPAAASASPPAVAPAAAPPKRGTLAEVFADFDAPSREVAPAAGAVDIRTVTPSKPAVTPPTRAGTGQPAATRPTPVPAKPAKPSHPSRIWVQLSTVREKPGLASDWRRFSREDPELFRSRKPFTSAFGQSNRLLVGPFESQAQASVYLAQLKKAGVSGAFVWTSPAGQVVDALAVK